MRVFILWDNIRTLHTWKAWSGGAAFVASLLALALPLVDGEDTPDMNGENNWAVAAASPSGNCKTEITITIYIIILWWYTSYDWQQRAWQMWVRLYWILDTFALRICRTFDLYMNPAIIPQMPGTSDRFHDDNKSWRNTPTFPWTNR